MPTVLNTFDTGVASALIDRLRAYLDGLGEEYRCNVVGKDSDEVQRAVLVAVSPTELEEVVYSSGHYRVAVDVTVKVDATEDNEGGAQRHAALSGAVLDALQQSDLATQLNGVTDATGRALCVVQGIVLEQSRLEDVGDWQLRRTYALSLFGFNPANS